MLWILVSFLVLSAAGGAVYVYTQTDKPKAMEILRDLGIQESAPGEDVTPYYKWIWDQESEDCISAGRIVAQAFQKARTWIDADDLKFFRELCHRYQSGAKIDDAEIVKYVNRIVERTESLNQLVGEQVENAVQPILSMSEQEAREQLKQSGIFAEDGVVIQKYCSLELRRLLNRIGMQVLGLESRGLSVREPETGRVLQLRGLDIWEHCIHAVRMAITELLESRKVTVNPQLLRSLKNSIERGIVTDYEDDVRHARSFLDILKDWIRAKRIHLSIEQVERCDLCFYGWKFAKGIPFKQADHDRLRDLLTDETLSPHFCELAMQNINASIGSLGKIVDMFPRCVIFYGNQSKARAFVISTYFYHIKALLDALALPADRIQEPPLLLEITQDEVDQFRFNDQDSGKTGFLSTLLGNRTQSAEPFSSPDFGKLIGKRQRLFTLDQQIPTDAADQRGWLINLPSMELEPAEFSELDSGKFAAYARFFCDTSSKSDFESENDSTRKKRMQLLTRMFDTLIDFHVNQTPLEVELPEPQVPVGNQS